MFELFGGTAGQKSQASHVDAEDGHLMSVEQPRAAQQGPVASEREQRIQVVRISEHMIPVLARQVLLELETQIQARRETTQGPERSLESGVAGVTDDTQADGPAGLPHPANASDSSIARTRFAMPWGVRPHCSSCLPRDAATMTRSGT